MPRNYSLAVFLVFAALLGFLVWLQTGSFALPEGNDAIWFNAGLLVLLLGTFITEYRFTKPNDVFVNCITVFASISTLSNPPNAFWWDALRWIALGCGAIAIFLAWDPGQEAKLRASAVRTFVYQVVTRLGSAKVIFSLVFILALVSYFDLADRRTTIFVWVWGVFVLVAHLELPRLSGIAWRFSKNPKREIVGIAHSFLSPSIVFCRRIGKVQIPLFSIVGFSQSAEAVFHSFGLLIGTRSSAEETRLVFALLNGSIDDGNINDQTLAIKIEENDKARLEEIVKASDVEATRKIIGTVARGTNIGQLRFEIFGNPKISAGSLLAVHATETSKAFYQVFDGVIGEEVVLPNNSRSFVEGHAEQIGCWDGNRGGFETHDWVAKERSPVFLIDTDDDAPNYLLRESEISIGVIPRSNYSVNIDLNDLTLFHTGILGVTGTGKSYLAFKLIEECANKGIKVICVDPTGDYQRYLGNAVMLSRPGACEAFLNSPDFNIGIIETASFNVHPIQQAYVAANVCLNWCKQNRQDAEILSPKPKVMLVLEEAHLLIPEWNFNNERGMQDRVNQTSQIVLQARKFGLGFMIVSQRTANVTKSILNQCNTIFSFQAFDETGFDFLRNYMGNFHVQSLPNLKARHGLLVGKASRSRRPIMVRFDEQDRELRDAPAPVMALPEVLPVPEDADEGA